MPITPFHFGPGLLFRAVTRHVSLSAFVLVNCVIDIEPILAFLLTGDPQHRFLHTYLGATVSSLSPSARTALAFVSYSGRPLPWEESGSRG